ncbi:MAG: glycosyltransferase, partial [bacterium]
QDKIKNKEVSFKNRSNTKILGYIGTIYEGKGVEYLIDQILSYNDDELVLNIYGEAQCSVYLSKLKSKVKNSNINFMGYEETSKIFDTIDILVVPSLLNEAFGRTIIEAYSYGIPVIGAKRGGIPELIKEGKTGFTFDPSKPNEFRNVMEKILKDDLVSKFSKQCFSVAYKYLPSVISEQYSELYYMTLNNELS